MVQEYKSLMLFRNTFINKLTCISYKRYIYIKLSNSKYPNICNNVYIYLAKKLDYFCFFFSTKYRIYSVNETNIFQALKHVIFHYL